MTVEGVQLVEEVVLVVEVIGGSVLENHDLLVVLSDVLEPLLGLLLLVPESVLQLHEDVVHLLHSHTIIIHKLMQ